MNTGLLLQSLGDRKTKKFSVGVHWWCVLPSCGYYLHHQASLTFGSWFSWSRVQGLTAGRGGRLFEGTGILLGVGDTPRRRGSFLVWGVVMTGYNRNGEEGRIRDQRSASLGIGAVLTSLIPSPSLKSMRPEDPAPARPVLLGATSGHPEPTLSPQEPELPLLMNLHSPHSLQDPHAAPSPEPLRVAPTMSLSP